MKNSGHELALIEWIRRHSKIDPHVVMGIGDDTAVLRLPDTNNLLVTVDMLMDGVHFTLPTATPRQIGYKTLAVNLSDIAAMAGKPLAAFVAVALPRDRDLDFAEDIHSGLLELASQFDVTLAGGDTNSWNGPLVISVTLIGEATGTGPVNRSGAQIGDWIFVTGSLGGSLSGSHLDFQPRVAEAIQLHEFVSLHAMIDTSDGLSSDLNHILDESHVAAIIREANIPISDEALAVSDDKSPLEHAISDGEDFELLFTVSPQDGHKLLDSPPFELPIAHIGEIVEGQGCRLQNVDGDLVQLARMGWEH